MVAGSHEGMSGRRLGGDGGVGGPEGMGGGVSSRASGQQMALRGGGGGKALKRQGVGRP